MKRKIIMISMAVIVIAVLGMFVYLRYRGNTLSPPGSAEITNGNLKVSITYSRPSMRGRLIFGDESDDALQPYGKYWRLGANEVTTIEFNRDVSFNGTALKEGSYALYAIPGAEVFEIGVNSETGRWGYSEPDYSKDLFKTKVPVEKTASPVEQYTVTLKNGAAANSVDVVFEWADVRFVVPIVAQ